MRIEIIFLFFEIELFILSKLFFYNFILFFYFFEFEKIDSNL